MRGRKEALWALVISAALVTAGLTLSCGDEDNGGAAVDCRAACEQYIMCTGNDDLGDNVAECIDACEQELAEAREDLREGLAEAYQCISDTECDDIKGECFCKPACQKLADCDVLQYDTMADCVYECYYYWSVNSTIFRCFYGFSSCQLIYWCWD